MQNHVIALGRQFGSGGREIGRRLSQSLGFAYYDRELISLAAQRAQVREELFVDKDEKAANPWLFKGFYEGGPRVKQGQSAEDILFQMQSEVIQELSEKSSCIIVGRCADHVLRDFPNKFDFFIHGSIEDRVKRIQTCGDYEIEGKTPQAALDKMDKQRSTYYNYYTGKVWGKCDHYDLCINAGRLGVEYSTDIILEYINRLKK